MMEDRNLPCGPNTTKGYTSVIPFNIMTDGQVDNLYILSFPPSDVAIPQPAAEAVSL